FPMEGVDLSIRMGRGAWPGVKSDLLFREQLVPVATPAYLESVRRDGAINWPKVAFLRVSPLDNAWAASIDGAGAHIEIAEDMHLHPVGLDNEAPATGMG